MTDTESLAVFALVSRDLPDETEAIRHRDVWRLIKASRQGGLSLQGLIDSGDISPEILPPELSETATSRLGLLDDAEALIERYREAGIWSLTPFDEGWPSRLEKRLGPRAPALLHGAGDPDLLAQDGIGIVGSRNLSPEGEGVAQKLAGLAAGADFTVVSGAARGVDQIAMRAAMQHGGRALGVLAHPLVSAARQAETAEHIEAGHLCLITPFKPSAGFSVASAMSRNRLIYGLSKVTVVVASDYDSGGTWAGATEALRHGFGAVAVWRGTGDGPGNSKLEARGAAPIMDAEQILDVRAAPPPQMSILDPG